MDFTSIRRISLAGAVVLAAEIDRWRHWKRARLAPRDLEKWDPEVRRRLNSLGFFDLLDVPIKQGEIEGKDDENVTLLPLISGQRLEREELYELLSALMNVVARVLQQDPRVYGALVEAVYNSVRHAYPEEISCEFPTLKNGWWASAGWNPGAHEIKLWVYDQGVGIPSTLPKSVYWETVRSWLAKAPVIGNRMRSASHLIKAALEIDRTSLDGGHGKGLQDVIAPVQEIAGGRVRILSGHGSILHTQGRTKANDDAELHLGGTLIEWTIPIVNAAG